MHFFHALVLVLCSVIAFPLLSQSAEKPHAVLIAGTHHYSPQASMPKFAAELERLGFRTTVINPAWDPEKDKRGLPGLEALADADVGLFFVRFLKLEDEQLQHITAFVEAGKPLVCFRTSTHAFNYPKGHKHHALNMDFGRDAFGTPYRIHLKGQTKVAPVADANKHPILTGIDTADWISPGTLYLTQLQPGTTPLLAGTGKSRPGKRTNAFGTHDLKAEMTDTVAWTWENKWGGRVFSTSLGHLGDFAVPESMRVMVNGTFWAAGQAVPSAATPIQTFGPGSNKKSAAKPAGKPAATPAVKKGAEKNAKSAAKAQPKVAANAAAKTGLPNIASNADGLTILYGNSFVERLQEEGTFETLMHAADPGQKHTFRSFAYTGDEIDFRIRPEKFGPHLGYLCKQLKATRVMMCFGMNESFEGAEGLSSFERSLETYLSIIQGRHENAELILVSPTAVEAAPAVGLPDPSARNQDVALYADAIRRVAAKMPSIRYIDLFQPSLDLFASAATPLTTNGLHLNTAGNQAIAKVLASALRSPETIKAIDTTSPGFVTAREWVGRKAYEVAMAYHPANGIHYYGTRGRSYEYVVEIPHHLKLANTLDAAVWRQVQELDRAQPAPELETVSAVPPPKSPRKGLGTIQPSAADLAQFDVADGFEVNLFASSEDHPELINPLQIQFDARGRLWVTCVESYPVPLPGVLSNDKILIFEDSDGDGKADKKTVFADGLKIPDGFVLYQDGIIVSVTRKLLWLRDTDGDGQADTTEELLRGADDTDTHHSGYLARTPQGHVIYCEGLFHRGQFETPHGPLRTKDACAMYFHPRTQKLTIERQTTHPNPWKITYNRWGESIQMFGGGQIIDCELYNISTPVGTSSSATMGMPFRDDKGCAIAVVSSPHFPDSWQGGLVTGHLLAKNAVLFTPLKNEGGTYVKAENSINLVSSPNKVFRPVDLKFGTDGALYISDFYYPIIGHAQHSVRDKNRDYDNGRIWRVTQKDTPLSTRPAIDGANATDLVSLLAHPQVLVRELARYELEKHSADSVLAAANAALPTARENQEFGLELLWLYERLDDFSNVEFLRQLLDASDVNVRRAAARSLRWWAPVLGEEAKTIAQTLLDRDDDRTTLAILSVASHLQQQDADWRRFIDNTKAAPSSPVDRAAKLAALYNTPPLNPEFPLLEVDPDTRLAGWRMNDNKMGGAIYVKSDTTQDLIYGFRNNHQVNLNLNNSPLHRATGSQHTKSGQVNITLKPGINKLEYFISGNPRRVREPELYLASPTGKRPQTVTFAAAESEHTAWATTYDAANATVTANRIYLKSVPSKLAYNVTEITVVADRNYDVVFENPDHMLHNLVITKPGQGLAVGLLANQMAAQPDAMAKHYVPDSDLVLFATPQIPYGEKVTLPFKTPAEPGSYPFICSFPGHWAVMKGEMIVTAAAKPAAAPPVPVQKKAAKEPAPKAPKAAAHPTSKKAFTNPEKTDWNALLESSKGLSFEHGFAAPRGKTASLRTKMKSFESKRSAASLTVKQSPVWQNWNPIPNIGPANLGDAPVMLTLGPDNYWMFGRYRSPRAKKGAKPVPKFNPEPATVDGFDMPLQTTPYANQYVAPGGQKPNPGGYHAWQSRDMKTWVHHGAVTDRTSSWVTSAEYIDGNAYIYYDFPNDQDPHLTIDDDLFDGQPGKKMGKVLDDPSHGSDSGFIRDLQGKVHVIFENWDPISANKRSWDSPLAGHAVSPDGKKPFEIKAPAVDYRTTPTGKMATFNHPHWVKEDPKNYKTNVAKYEIHEPEQEAYGDWAAIAIGGQYYLFGDFDPVGGHQMSVGWFTASSIDQPFVWCDNIGKGHPDPDVCFAEGQFYLATQQAIDYVSPGPWVERVQARVGVDTTKDGNADHWSDWSDLKESYDYIPGFSKQVKRIPAQLDLASLPEGYGFQVELKIEDVTDNKSKPMIQSIDLSIKE